MAKIDEEKWRALLRALGELKESDGRIYLGTSFPYVDVVVDGDMIKTAVDMPGVRRVKIWIEDGGKILHIRAEGDDRRYWSLTELPAAADRRGIRYKYKNGILYIELPMKRPFALL